MAWPYLKPKAIDFIKNHRDSLCVMVDSGAFTFSKKGQRPTIQSYADFIRSLPFEPFKYFTLDEIGNPEYSFRNYEGLLKLGLNPVPIFTRGANIKDLNRYYETADVVGIGGLVKTPRNKGFVKGIMPYIAGRKTHWLGFCSSDFVHHYKPFSCDSTTWNVSAMCASMYLYIGGGRIMQIKKADFSKKLDPKVAEYIRNLGFEPTLFHKNSTWQGNPSLTQRIGAKSAVMMSRWLEKNYGTKMFLACGSEGDLQTIIKEYES